MKTLKRSCHQTKPSEDKGHHHVSGNKIVLIATSLLMIAYFLSLISASSSYLDLRNNDLQAMSHSLFPSYFVIVPTFAILCLVYAFSYAGNKYIYVVLVIEFSIMLWFTSFYLSGFSRHPDGIYHSAVSEKIPEILESSSSSFRSGFYRYGKEYPISFIFNHIAMKLAGIDVFTYSRLAYPLFFSIAISLLWFVFASRLFNSRIGFLSALVCMLIASPEVHPSPHSAGTILVLISAILLFTFNSYKPQGLGLLAALTSVLTHPISPLILVLFMVTPMIMKRLTSENRVSSSISGMLGLLVVWFGWAFYNAIGTGETVTQSLERILTFNFASQLEDIASRASTIGGSIFPEINLLSKIVTYGLFALVFVLFARMVTGLDLKSGAKSFLLQIGRRMGYKRLFVAILAFLCLVFAYLIVFAQINPGTGTYFERGATWFYLAIAMFISASVVAPNHFRVQSKSRRIGKKIAILSLCAWFVFAAAVRPLISFQAEIYSGYPPSEGAGLKFMSSQIPLSGKTVSCDPATQIIPFIDLNTSFTRVPYSIVYSSSNFAGFGSLPPPDVIVFRKTMYFQVVFRYDLSLNDNRFTRTLKEIDGFPGYQKIYSSSTFEIYTQAHNST